jgi:formate C-acetyltransferase
MTPLSRGCSPSEFIPSDNPASVILSLKEIDFTDYADSFCAELTLPQMKFDKGVEVITVLINMFIERGGSSLQINILDRDVLIEAQALPELHRNVCVRVCGYSARFVTLCKEIQDEIISRDIR